MAIGITTKFSQAQQRNGRSTEKIGPQETVEAHTAGQNRDDLGLVGHLRREENHSDKGEQPAELVDEKGYEIEVIGKGYLRQRRLQLDEIVDFFRSVENHDDHDNQRNGENVSPEELTHDVAIEDFNSGKLDFHNLRDSFSTITGFHSEKVPCKICSRASPTSQR